MSSAQKYLLKCVFFIRLNCTSILCEKCCFCSITVNMVAMFARVGPELKNPCKTIMPTVIYIIKNSNVAVPSLLEVHSRVLLEFSLKFPTPDLKSCFLRSLTF